MTDTSTVHQIRDYDTTYCNLPWHTVRRFVGGAEQFKTEAYTRHDGKTDAAQMDYRGVTCESCLRALGDCEHGSDTK